VRWIPWPRGADPDGQDGRLEATPLVEDVGVLATKVEVGLSGTRPCGARLGAGGYSGLDGAHAAVRASAQQAGAPCLCADPLDRPRDSLKSPPA